MKVVGVIVVFLIVVSICSVANDNIYVYVGSQQDFIDSCINEEIKDSRILIFHGTICSACLGENVYYEALIFKEDTLGVYKVRYLRYIDKISKIVLVMDTVIVDKKIQNIFNIIEPRIDSVIDEIQTINDLSRPRIVVGKDTLYGYLVAHGRMRYLAVYYNGNLVKSFHLIVDLNMLFKIAYYYRLLNSVIHNYYIEVLRKYLPTDVH